ncbi:Two-component sensor histidine kinase, contains HisKA and HATPase domains [Loktanella atrilutea]|uniref:histidine kinase n=1 Tax=Loktanella atrilutea TaxID=366533 RepID=A0A1M4ZLB4_LOKAT|nr:Two-component sensor histidine kinase, contains HisKA and HATPase domains [Loktanella atrilutea]
MSSVPVEKEDRWPFLQSLPFRVVAFLSLALLPIGLLAIWQTQNLDETLRARTALSLVALTELAISGERQTLQRAIGAARGQAATFDLTDDDPAACRAAFRAFSDADPSISFAGFLQPSGQIECSSEAAPFSIGSDDRARAVATSANTVLKTRHAAEPGEGNSVILLQPVVQDGVVRGQIVLALPTDQLSSMPDLDNAEPPLSLVIFDRNGRIIANQGEAPVNPVVDLSQEALLRLGADPSTFVGRNADGERRVFVMLTLVPDLAYAMTGWAPTEGFLASSAITLPSFFLPALMWLASLLVAYFAVHRLVVSPVQDLRTRMRRFASDRALPKAKSTEMLPQELFDLEQTFVNMAYDLIDDEARMENSLREKNVLLKEVHHRVKNNLQMISSIMNMQIRSARSDESRHALKRLQDRVLGLATVHRYIYQSKDLARTEAQPLMQDICGTLFDQLPEIGTDITHDLKVDNFHLLPDQAVPLALLVGEVGTNALQHMRAATPTEDAPRFLMFSLLVVSPGMAQFQCRSSAGNSEGSGAEKNVGHQLIRAFSVQLGGKVETSETEAGHTVTVAFPITTTIPDALDY